MFGAKLKKINKSKHYSSEFNIAHLPGTGLREARSITLKWCWAYISKDVWYGRDLLSKILIPLDANETAPTGPDLAREHSELFVGKCYSNKLPIWVLQKQHKIQGDQNFAIQNWMSAGRIKETPWLESYGDLSWH